MRGRLALGPLPNGDVLLMFADERNCDVVLTEDECRWLMLLALPAYLTSPEVESNAPIKEQLEIPA